MDFFKSLVSDDPDPSQSDESAPNSPTPESQPGSGPEDNNQSDDDDQLSDFVGGWNLGGLMQTLATRSESVLETYRRDLQEFGTGLKKETHIFREGAQGAIDGVLKSTAEIISHGKESLLSVSNETETPNTNRRPYSRFEAQLKEIQRDVRTYTDVVEDLEDFKRWKMGFALIDKGEEIEGLIGGEGEMKGVYKKVVPGEVDNETFWLRYFYRVEKLEKKESVRAKLVRRAIEIDDEEELSWDFDDDEEEEDESGGEGSVGKGKGHELDKKKDSSEQGVGGIEKVDGTENEKGDELDKKKDLSNQGVGGIEKLDAIEKEKGIDQGVSGIKKDGIEKEKGNELDKKKDLSDSVVAGIEEEDDRKAEMVNVSGGNVGDSKSNVESVSVKKENDVGLRSRDKVEVKNVEKVEKNEEKVLSEGEGKKGGVVKVVGVSVDSNEENKVDEEDLEWDEIENVDSSDEKKTVGSSEKSKSNEVDLRKRLSTAEDDEDLSWDIEDDD